MNRAFNDEYKRLKKYDPGRFVQFEQAWEDWNTDIVCPMYPNMENNRISEVWQTATIYHV